MPELPEVETTRRGLEPHLVGAHILQLVIRQHQLRWPVPKRLASCLHNTCITAVRRRAKYLLVTTESGTLIIHLGMSGSLRMVDAAAVPGPHDHVDLVISTGKRLRYTDPRRFGAVLWHQGDIDRHPLIGIDP